MNVTNRIADRIRSLKLPALILMGALGLVMLLWLTRTPPPTLVAEEKVWPVSTEAIQLRELTPSLQLYGRVESPSAAEMGSNIAADVEEVRVLEGESVRKGQLLVRMDDADPQIRLRGDEAALTHEKELLELAKKELVRAEQLFKDGLASQANVDAAHQTVEQRALAVVSRQQSLAGAKLTLERTRITAPFEGRVTRVAVAVGDRVTPGQSVVSLYDPSRLELRAPVPAVYLARLQQTLTGAGHLLAHVQIDGAAAPGVLLRLSGEARSGSSNVDGFFRLDPPRTDIEPGRTLEITLQLTAETGVAAVPFESLYQQNRIYVAAEGRMRGIAVERVGEYRAPGERPRMLVRSPQLKDGMQLITTQLPLAI
ncbi:MAG: efflux RND transporter periplasmic adaptor subunit, partial [Nevskiales bacterium]